MRKQIRNPSDYQGYATRLNTRLMAAPLGLCFVLISGYSDSAIADESSDRYLQRESVREYIRQLSAEHNFNVNRISGMFVRLTRQQRILDKISAPAERTLSWRQYRPIFVTPERIDKGREFLLRHRSLLEAAEREFGVPPEIITAIIGVETFYGRHMGSYRVLEALATLAFDYPPRSEFFARELKEFIVLSESEGWDTVNIMGSYAGAMGMPQFISSSYREYAIDFDQSGTRDLFTSDADIIGSVANYLARHGWRSDEPIATRWELPTGGVSADMRNLVTEELFPSVTAETVRKLGFDSPTLDVAAAPTELVSVMTMAGESGEELWVGYRNFYAITRYNHSRLYALAVFQLAEAIRARS